jgi:Flp pilus assembly CpaF family ATPase
MTHTTPHPISSQQNNLVLQYSLDTDRILCMKKAATIWIEEEYWEELKSLCKRQGRTLSWKLEQLVRRELRDKEKENAE